MGDFVVRGSRYSDEDRRAAVLLYLIYGNVTRVARQLDIPATTIQGWRQSDWWDVLSVEVREEKEEEVRAHLTNIVGAAFEELEDRLANGNVRLLKDGTQVRVPISGRDAAWIAAVMIDKRELLRRVCTTPKPEDTKAMLEEAAEFMRAVSDEAAARRGPGLD